MKEEEMAAWQINNAAKKEKNSWTRVMPVQPGERNELSNQRVVARFLCM